MGPRSETRRIPRSALWLGLTGAIPFAAGNLALAFPELWPELTAVADLAVTTYGAVVLSFLGGIRWGLGMNKDREERSRTLSMSVVPALLGWFALLMPGTWPALVLALGIAGQGVWDVKTAREDGAPEWYPRLRVRLTVLVCGLLLLYWLNSG